MFEIQAVMSRFSLYSYGVYFTFVLYYAMKSGILVVGAIAIAISTQEWFSRMIVKYLPDLAIDL